MTVSYFKHPLFITTEISWVYILLKFWNVLKLKKEKKKKLLQPVVGLDTVVSIILSIKMRRKDQWFNNLLFLIHMWMTHWKKMLITLITHYQNERTLLCWQQPNFTNKGHQRNIYTLNPNFKYNSLVCVGDIMKYNVGYISFVSM